jgi:hypothetical protein
MAKGALRMELVSRKIHSKAAANPAPILCSSFPIR